MRSFPVNRIEFDQDQASTYETTHLSPAISIIIPVYNGGTSFNHCLQSLTAVQSQVLEIIVVDDGGNDGSSDRAKQMGAIVLRFPSTGGPARARNQGAQVAKGNILFFIDADVTLTPHTIEQVKAAFRDRPGLKVLIGSYDDQPGATNFLSQYKNLFHHYTHQTASDSASTFWGACGAIRPEVFWAVGGFDERYRYPSVEDIELGYRLKRAGYSIQLCKDVQVKHLKNWRVGSLLRAEIFYRAIPWTQLLWRDRQFSNDLNLKNSSRFSLILTYLIVLCLSVGWWWNGGWLMAIGIGLVLLVLNWPVYHFFWQKRGFWFAMRVIPWHWLYFLYGGLGFGLGTLRYCLVDRPKMIPMNLF